MYSRDRLCYRITGSELPVTLVVDYGEKKPSSQIKKNLLVDVRTKCQSHGKIWYECYDADVGDYYGWVRKSDLTLE